MELKYQDVASSAPDYLKLVGKARRHVAYQLVWYLFPVNKLHDVHHGIAVAQNRFIRLCALDNGRIALGVEPSVRSSGAMTVEQLDKEVSWQSETWGHPVLDPEDHTFITSMQTVLWSATKETLYGSADASDDRVQGDIAYNANA